MVISDNSRGILYMNIAMATFTLNDTCMKIATQSVPLSQAIAIRGTLTVILLVVLAALTQRVTWRVARADGWLMAIRTVAELGATLLFLMALMHMPLANLSAILQTLPLAVTLGAAVAMGDKVGWRRMTAIAVGFCGVLLIVQPGTEGFDIWSVLALASVACVVVRDLSTRRFSAGVPSVIIALYSAVAVTIMGYAGLAVEDWVPMTGPVLLPLVGASLTLILGYLFVVMAMRIGDVAIIAPFRYTALLWAIMLGWLAFGALPDQWTLLGAAIIVATGLYTYMREHRLHRRIAASRAVLTGAATPDR